MEYLRLPRQQKTRGSPLGDNRPSQAHPARPSPHPAGPLGQTDSLGARALAVLLQQRLQDPVLEPNKIHHFLKGELDPRPTFQRASVPSRKTGPSSCVHVAPSGKRGSKHHARRLPQCAFAPSCLFSLFPHLGKGLLSSLGWFSEGGPPGLTG